MNRWPALSRPLDAPRLRVLSHGGGVQTTTLAFMTARGDIEPPDVAIFADTGGERRAVYDYLDWLEPQLPFPLLRAARPGPTLAAMSEEVAAGVRSKSGSPLPPWFFHHEGERKLQMMPKHCSAEFKREVVNREVRRLAGLAPGQRLPADARGTVELWIGMTTDELFRVASSRYPLVHNRHPLVELGMSRNDCVRWLQERQLPVPPKSSCVFCPYRTNAQWRALKADAPDDFAEAVRVDAAIRTPFPGFAGQAYVHRSLVPLDSADLNDEHPDQLGLPLGADCDSCGL